MVKTPTEQGMLVHACNPIFQSLKQEEYHRSEATLGYILSLGPAQATR